MSKKKQNKKKSKQNPYKTDYYSLIYRQISGSEFESYNIDRSIMYNFQLNDEIMIKDMRPYIAYFAALYVASFNKGEKESNYTPEFISKLVKLMLERLNCKIVADCLDSIWIENIVKKFFIPRFIKDEPGEFFSVPLFLEELYIFFLMLICYWENEIITDSCICSLLYPLKLNKKYNMIGLFCFQDTSDAAISYIVMKWYEKMIEAGKLKEQYFCNTTYNYPVCEDYRDIKVDYLNIGKYINYFPNYREVSDDDIMLYVRLFGQDFSAFSEIAERVGWGDSIWSNLNSEEAKTFLSAHGKNEISILKNIFIYMKDIFYEEIGQKHQKEIESRHKAINEKEKEKYKALKADFKKISKSYAELEDLYNIEKEMPITKQLESQNQQLLDKIQELKNETQRQQGELTNLYEKNARLQRRIDSLEEDKDDLNKKILIMENTDIYEEYEQLGMKNLSQDEVGDNDENEEDITEFVKEIAKQCNMIFVIPNWYSSTYLEELFPNCKFVYAIEHFTAGSLGSSYDGILVTTKCISHALYYKIKLESIKNDVPIIPCHSTGLRKLRDTAIREHCKMHSIDCKL